MPPRWWPAEDSATTRPPSPAASAGHSRVVSAKCPRWFVPNWASQPGPMRVSGQAMIPALLISRSSGRPLARKRSAKSATLSLVGEVEFVDLDRVPELAQRLPCRVRAAGRHDDVRAGLREGAGRLQTDAGVAAGDNGEPTTEVDALHDLPGGAACVEAGVQGFLRGAGHLLDTMCGGGPTVR